MLDVRNSFLRRNQPGRLFHRRALTFYDGKEISNFYLLAIPLAVGHTSENMANKIVHLLQEVLGNDWMDK